MIRSLAGAAFEQPSWLRPGGPRRRGGPVAQRRPGRRPLAEWLQAGLAGRRRRRGVGGGVQKLSICKEVNSFKNDCDSIQFFSLHPKSTDRIENLKAFDPKTSQLFNMFRGAITIIVAAGYFTALAHSFHILRNICCFHKPKGTFYEINGLVQESFFQAINCNFIFLFRIFLTYPIYSINKFRNAFFFFLKRFREYDT